MAGSAGPDIVTDGLVLALDTANKKSYPGSGTTWYDLSGLGNNLSSANTHTYDTTGWQYTGVVADKFETSSAISIAGVTEYTVSTWVYFDSSNFSIDQRFFWHGNYAVMMYKNTDQKLRVYIRTDSTNKQPVYNTAIVADTWYHIAGTYNAAGTTASIYINGVEEGIVTDLTGTGIVNASATTLTLGSGTNNFPMTGKMGITTIYYRTLSDTEILKIYNQTKSRFI